MAGAHKAENVATHFPSGLVFSMKHCAGQLIVRGLVSGNERSSTVVEIIYSVENDLHKISSVHFTHDDIPLDIIRNITSRNILLLLWIDALPDGNSSALPGSDEIQRASSSRS